MSWLTFVSTSRRSGSRIKTQHRTIVDGLISSPPWDRRAAGHPPAFNNRFYPDSLRPSGRKAGPGVFSDSRENEENSRRRSEWESEKCDRYLLSCCAKEELSQEFRSAMVKVRGSARCAGKKREATMRHRDRCNSPTLASNVAQISNATYMRREYSDASKATLW